MSKSRSYYQRIKQDRDDWRLSVENRCMFCGVVASQLAPPNRLEIHEILRRSHAPNAWGFRANYLLACSTCHAGPLASMPHVEQLALKLVMDTGAFDLDQWLRVRDPRAMEYVTMPEVLAVVERIYQESDVGSDWWLACQDVLEKH